MKQIGTLLIIAVLYAIAFSILIPVFISGYFDAYDTGWFMISVITAFLFCYFPISNIWHLLTGRYEYYTEETEVNKFYRLGDKKVEALGIRPDEPVCEVTIMHTFDLHSHPKRVLTEKETKLKKAET